MALLVCYSQDPPSDHTLDKAVYLDQSFYIMLVSRCVCRDSSYTLLREIAELRYKSPTKSIQPDDVSILEADLTRLTEAGEDHSQIAQFRTACATAIERGCALTVSGDMHPELT